MRNLAHVDIEIIMNHLKTGNTAIIFVRGIKQQGRWYHCRGFYSVTGNDIHSKESISDDEEFTSIMDDILWEVIQASQIEVSELSCSYELSDHVISDEEGSDLRYQINEINKNQLLSNLLFGITDEELIYIPSTAE